jgi:hypothetical protein
MRRWLPAARAAGGLPRPQFLANSFGCVRLRPKNGVQRTAKSIFCVETMRNERLGRESAEIRGMFSAKIRFGISRIAGN